MDLSIDTMNEFSRPSRRGRYTHLSLQEVNMLLKQHTAARAMAFFDRLPPEERERVREGKAVVKGYTWQIQGRDAAGRFLSVSVR